jgi:hypothetical protein
MQQMAPVGDLPESGSPGTTLPQSLDAIDGRNWAIELHVGALQLVAALSTYLQLLRRQLDEPQVGRVDHMLEIAGVATRELRQLMARLEPPGDEASLLASLADSGRRVLDCDLDVDDRTSGSLGAWARSTVVSLTHRALVEMRRAGGRAPGRIDVVRYQGQVVVGIVVAAGDAVMRGDSTLLDRVHLAGGTATMETTPSELSTTIRIPTG